MLCLHIFNTFTYWQPRLIHHTRLPPLYTVRYSAILHKVLIDFIHKSHNLPVPYPTIHHHKQKCIHFCFEWCIVEYGTGALRDLKNCSVAKVEHCPTKTHHISPPKWDVYCQYVEKNDRVTIYTMTSSNESGFRVTGPLWGESAGHPSQRTNNMGFDIFFDIILNKGLNKQTRRQWFETSGCSLWRHCNELLVI